jgi:hypothetical protein
MLRLARALPSAVRLPLGTPARFIESNAALMQRVRAQLEPKQASLFDNHVFVGSGQIFHNGFPDSHVAGETQNRFIICALGPSLQVRGQTRVVRAVGSCFSAF